MRREPQQERAWRTVERILAAANQLFGEYGYDATTTTDIADAAGTSVASLYRYFPHKQEILLVLYGRHLDEVRPLMLRASRSHPDVTAEAWVAALVRALVLVNESDTNRVLYNAVPGAEQARDRVHELVGGMAAHARRHFRRWRVGEPAGRAEMVIVTALSLVHEVVIQHPRGARRDEAERHLRQMLVAFIDAPAAVLTPPAGRPARGC